MKIHVYGLITSSLALKLANCSTIEENKSCKAALFGTMINGDIFFDNFGASGKYLNELGSYSFCEQASNNSYYYSLQILETVEPINYYMVGKCMMKECPTEYIKVFDQIAYLSPLSEKMNQAVSNSYKKPSDDLQQLQDSFAPGYYVMWGLFISTILLSILGVLVQYTSFGDIQNKSHNFQVKFSEKEGKQQYIELLSQIDRLILNRKKIWAIFLLCFSIPRNLTSLFYDLDNAKKVSYMRALKVFGFIWISFNFVLGIAFKAFPQNQGDYPEVTTNFFSVILLQGQIYGFGLFYFYSGFHHMYENLICIYVKRQNFNVVIFAIRTIIMFFLSMVLITSIMVAFFPFLGSGPLYAFMSEQIFINTCKKYWWTNLLLINNFYPWNLSDQCGLALTFFSNDVQMVLTLIPLYLYLYKNTYRKVFIISFLIIAFGASFIPTFYYTFTKKVNSFPNIDTKMAQEILSRLFYRIPLFLCGIALAILKFEYKYVDKLNDGSFPFHKKFLINLKQKKYCYAILYTVGFSLILFPLLIQLSNVACVDQSPVPDMTFKALNYCWPPLVSAFYNVLCQPMFFTGIILVIIPSMINLSDILRPLVSSHLFQILEELTYSAYLLHFVIVSWYFASREQDIILTLSYLFQIGIASAMFSYLISIPFYVLCERPCRNFIDLILFPKNTIFKKVKDVDDEETDEETEDDDINEVKIDTNFNKSLFLSTQDQTTSPSDFSLKRKARESKRSRQFTMKQDNKCRFCQGEDRNCTCNCMTTKKKCECANKSSFQSQSVYKSSGLNQRLQSKNTLNSEGRYSNTKRDNPYQLVTSQSQHQLLSKLSSQEYDKKRVSFDVNNLK
ncbi:UNKNOWN [Stylonychia lemnae]|uniref:Acyltransferase 3 domain-containing protein n=1 Tax=Stylonychia lemnae TaxID=5949 RepID=A0A078AWA0_STYLE|nr:UNKNOWN [Stylonychia lemnae]|eukprot:CDW85512.1 UNKNOWN [Stylonychia lemnae]